MSRPTVEVADILRAQGDRFVERNRSWLGFQRLSVLRAITRCRTAALGGHIDGWDRARARPALGGGLPFLLFRLQDGFSFPPWRRFPWPPYNAGRRDFPGPV
jgi:hypothetical protein